MSKLIRKCQKGNPVLAPVDWNNSIVERNRAIGLEVVNRGISKVQTLKKQADHKQAVEQKINAKAPLDPRRTKNSEVIRLQDALYHGGFANGASYKKFVDGLHGKNTQAALDRAIAAGYDEASLRLGKLVKRNTQSKTSSNVYYVPTPGGMMAMPVRNQEDFEPVKFYVRDIFKGLGNILTGKTESVTRTNDNVSDSFHKQAQELAALRLAMGPSIDKKGNKDWSISPEVYRQYNYQRDLDPTYADFGHPTKFANPARRVEYSDGGMSMIPRRNPDGSYNVTLKDEAAWDPDKGQSYFALSPRGLPITLGVTKENLGDDIDRMEYNYTIPKEMIDSIRNVYKNDVYVKGKRKEGVSRWW